MYTVPVNSLDTYNNSEDIKTLKKHIWNHVPTKKVFNKFFKVATLMKYLHTLGILSTSIMR